MHLPLIPPSSACAPPPPPASPASSRRPPCARIGSPVDLRAHRVPLVSDLTSRVDAARVVPDQLPAWPQRDSGAVLRRAAKGPRTCYAHLLQAPRGLPAHARDLPHGQVGQEGLGSRRSRLQKHRSALPWRSRSWLGACCASTRSSRCTRSPQKPGPMLRRSRAGPQAVMSKYASSMDTGCTLALDLSSVL